MKDLSPAPFSKIFNVLAYGAKGDGVTNDQPAIAAACTAINAAGGGELYFPPGSGTYILNSPIMVPANTIVTVPWGVTLKASGTATYCLRNNSAGMTNYGAPGNILVRGKGTIDANAAARFTGDAGGGGITFVQCQNVTVEGVTIKNVYNWHAIEYQAVKNGVIRDVTATDFTYATSGWAAAEAFQLDLNTADSYRPCDNILITGCTVKGYGKITGSHASRNGQPHTNIRVIGNYGEGLHHYAIGGEHWHRVVVGNNQVINSNGLVQMYIPALDDTGVAFTTHRKNIVIVGNSIDGSGTVNGGGSAVAAAINIESDSTMRHYDVLTSGNVLQGSNAVGVRYENFGTSNNASVATANVITNFTSATSFTGGV